MIDHRAGMQDILSYGSSEDTCLVLPTLRHAVAIWPDVIAMFKDRHSDIVTTRTALISRSSRTFLRLWVPYDREPTMPADTSRWRTQGIYVDQYRRLRWKSV